MAASATTPAAVAANPDEDAAADSNNEEGRPEVWAPYIVRSIDFGAPHPGKLVEAFVLAATDLPKATYPLEESLGLQIKNKTLSRVQLEGILFASQRFQTFTPNSEKQYRAGFLIADSAGVGKGRQIAGLILDNLVRGRNKHCWFSVSQDLHLDATRDLRDIGCLVNVVRSIADLHELKTPKQRRDPCVLFSTYAGLISRGNKTSGKTRMDELIDWLCVDTTADAYEGVIVFDEAHKAKNFKPDGAPDSTQVGEAVHKLQQIFPKARILYSSATMVSDVSEMAYMTRLGYWGPNCMYETFEKFKQAMSSMEVSGMELLAVDMKATGRALVRNVSYEGAEFQMATAELEPKDARQYRDACAFWLDLLVQTRLANSYCNNDVAYEGSGKSAGMHYWSAHQRFFAQLILSMKVEKCVKEVQLALQNGMAAVIGLQTTGGAALNRSMDSDLNCGDGSSSKLISVCKSVAMLFLKTQFPVKRKFTPPEGAFAFYQPKLAELKSAISQVVDSKTGCKALPNIKELILDYTYEDDIGAVDWPMYRENDDIVECIRMRDMLIDRLEKLNLPTGALDTLIDRLGGKENVAEMTGRPRRQIRSKVDPNRFVIEERDSTGYDEEEDDFSQQKWWTDTTTTKFNSVNVLEKNAFLNDFKRVAIISSAASTGISLHADRAVKNQRRRFHITLELPWAGDQAVQQLGRSHRTNQSSAPVFCLMSSGLGGENRFMSSVARRLQSLGALTQGDRRASLGAMSFGELLYESKHGIKACKLMFKQSTKEDPAVVDGVKWQDVVGECQVQIDLDFAGGDSHLLRVCPLARCDTESEFLCVVAEALFALDLHMDKNLGDRLVPSFLNRILGLPILQQTLLFTYFAKCLDAVVLDARKKGRFDEGFKQLDGKVDRNGESKIMYTDSFGRSAVVVKLVCDTSTSFMDAILEIYYRMNLRQGILVSKESLRPIVMKMNDMQISFMLSEAKEEKVAKFYHQRNRSRADPTHFILLYLYPETNVAMHPVIRPTHKGRIHMDDLHEKFKSYDVDHCTSAMVEEIREQWEQSLNCQQARKRKRNTVELVCGNLLPILGDLDSVFNTNHEHRRALESYIVETNNTKERLFGIKMQDLKKVQDKLANRTRRDHIVRITSNAQIRIGDIPTHNFGFEVDKQNQVVSVVTKDYGIDVGMELLNAMGVQLEKNAQPFRMQVYTLAKNQCLMDHAGEMPKSKPNIDVHVMKGITFEFLRKTTLNDHLFNMEQPGKVSHIDMDALNVNPKKEKSRMEKRERKLKRLFDTDSEDEVKIKVTTTPSTSGKKKSKSSSAAAAATETPVKFDSQETPNTGSSRKSAKKQKPNVVVDMLDDC